MFEVLTDRENDILERRYGDKQTLQAVGDHYHLTRERVRQLEEVALDKLWKTSEVNGLKPYLKEITEVFNYCGGIVPNNMLPSIYELRIALYCNRDIERVGEMNKYRKGWKYKNISNEFIQETCDSYYRSLERAQTAVNISKRVHCMCLLLDRRFITIGNCVFGLEKWRWMNPKSIDDYVEIVLREAGTDLHFKTIAHRVNVLRIEARRTKVSVNGVHNAIMNNSNFVNTGRGLYKLRDSDTIEGDTADVIYEILKRNGKPMKVSEVVEEVLKYKKVKRGTIVIALQRDSRFERVGRSIYQLTRV